MKGGVSCIHRYTTCQKSASHTDIATTCICLQGIQGDTGTPVRKIDIAFV